MRSWTIEVCDGSRDAKDLVVSSSDKPLLSHRVAEHIAFGGPSRRTRGVAGVQLRIGASRFAAETLA